MRKREIREIVLKVSDGLVSTLVDVVLIQIFFGYELAFSGGRSPSSVYRAMEKAHIDLAQINYQQIKRAIYALKKKGFIYHSSEKRKAISPRLSPAGKKHLTSFFPVYNEKRTWNKRIYLVIYDIPEEKKSDRNMLRGYLKRIGCGMLQASVWLTLYNPKNFLSKFVEERGLVGQVLISDLGKDGNIGGEDLKKLVARIYDLDKINNRYFNFIRNWRAKKRLADFEKAKISFAFFSILKSDPQLPFKLLPKEWLGCEAYKLYRRLSDNIM